MRLKFSGEKYLRNNRKKVLYVNSIKITSGWFVGGSMSRSRVV